MASSHYTCFFLLSLIFFNAVLIKATPENATDEAERYLYRGQEEALSSTTTTTAPEAASRRLGPGNSLIKDGLQPGGSGVPSTSHGSAGRSLQIEAEKFHQNETIPERLAQSPDEDKFIDSSRDLFNESALNETSTTDAVAEAAQGSDGAPRELSKGCKKLRCGCGVGLGGYGAGGLGGGCGGCGGAAAVGVQAASYVPAAAIPVVAQSHKGIPTSSYSSGKY